MKNNFYKALGLQTVSLGDEVLALSINDIPEFVNFLLDDINEVVWLRFNNTIRIYSYDSFEGTKLNWVKGE